MIHDSHTSVSAEQGQSVPERQSLDASECLAGAVLGRLLTWGFISKVTLKDEAMRVIHEEIADAIRQAYRL